MMILSLFFIINKREVKYRLYEDDDETCIIDFNNAVNRRKYKEVRYVKNTIRYR